MATASRAGSGETDLDALLAVMALRLNPRPCVFCAWEGTEAPPGLAPICTFREDEGMTLMLERDEAERAGLAWNGEWAWITLTVHSALNAVGFLAAVTRALAEAGISANAVSAFYHDHLFVPWDRREDAMRALEAIATH